MSTHFSSFPPLSRLLHYTAGITTGHANLYSESTNDELDAAAVAAAATAACCNAHRTHIDRTKQTRIMYSKPTVSGRQEGTHEYDSYNIHIPMRPYVARRRCAC